MEYLASGVPTLLYKLPGIPEEYYEHCFSIQELGVQPLSDMISDVLRLNPIELEAMASKARKFILQTKNPIVQSQKVVDLINNF